MSRCLTLEEYLQEFVDENTQSAACEDLTLLITERQAQTLGFFLISGLTCSIEQMRAERARRHSDQDEDKFDFDELVH